MVLDLGRIKHRADIMHKSVGSNGIAIPSNARLSADGQKNVIWTPFDPGSAVTSFGSNATDITTATAAGASANAAREDHRHRGVRSITANGSNTLFGNVDLQAGTGIAIGVTGQVITLSNIAAGASGGGGGSGPTDYVSGASGTGQIIIPGLAGSSDIRVAATNDDEFDTTDTSDPMTGWTTLGTPTAHDINSTAKSHYFISINAASVSLTGIYKTVPSIPFTVTCKLSEFSILSTPSRFLLFVGEAGGAGKIESVGMDGGAGSTAVDVWTNRTTFSAQTGLLSTNTTGRRSLYLRIVVTLSTNVSYYTSMGGHIWTANSLTRNPGFTVGIVGLCVNPTGATTQALFDWIRFT